MGLILVVEDDKETGDFLRVALQRSGHAVILLESAERTREILDKVIPNLALLDINLPGDSGVQLSWELREQLPKLHILIMSALLEAWSEDDLRDCGADRIIPKPIELDELLTIIKNFMG